MIPIQPPNDSGHKPHAAEHSRTQITGLLIIAISALVYLLVRYGAKAPWSWR